MFSLWFASTANLIMETSTAEEAIDFVERHLFDYADEIVVVDENNKQHGLPFWEFREKYGVRDMDME